MRQHNKYLEKVLDELSVYERYSLDASQELTPIQLETWEKLVAVRAWLQQGYSDNQVIHRCKVTFCLQDRRSRELITMTYNIFAELRRSRSQEGVKYKWTEVFLEAAKRAEEAGDFRAAAVMMDKAAKADGAYQAELDMPVDDQKKPRKVVINVKKLIVQKNSDSSQEKLISDIDHEIVG